MINEKNTHFSKIASALFFANACIFAGLAVFLMFGIYIGLKTHGEQVFDATGAFVFTLLLFLEFIINLAAGYYIRKIKYFSLALAGIILTIPMAIFLSVGDFALIGYLNCTLIVLIIIFTALSKKEFPKRRDSQHSVSQ